MGQYFKGSGIPEMRAIPRNLPVAAVSWLTTGRKYINNPPLNLILNHP